MLGLSNKTCDAMNNVNNVSPQHAVVTDVVNSQMCAKHSVDYPFQYCLQVVAKDTLAQFCSKHTNSKKKITF